MDKVSNKKGDFKKAGDGIKKMFSNLNPWSKKSKQNREKVRAKMGLNPKAPPKKPELVSSKFKRKPDGSQQKITIPARLQEIKREDAMDNIKKVAKKMGSGGSGKSVKSRNKIAAALRLDDRYKPKIVRDRTKYNRKSKWSKHYGMKAGGSPKKPYGMKHGGSGKSVCRGMGAATRGGNYTR